MEHPPESASDSRSHFREKPLDFRHIYWRNLWDLYTLDIPSYSDLSCKKVEARADLWIELQQVSFLAWCMGCDSSYIRTYYLDMCHIRLNLNRRL